MPQRAFAQGGPPLMTDDPGTVEKGHFEINSGITAEYNSSSSLLEFPFIDINFGVSNRQHLNFEVPLISKYTSGDEPKRGIGKVGIGTKYRFFNQDSVGIDVSMHPAFYFVISSIAVENGVIDGGTELFIPLALQKEFGINIYGLEIGRLINSKSEGTWTFGILYARDLNTKVNIAGELNGNVNSALHETNILLNIGTRISMTNNLILLFSGGRSLVLPNGEEPVYIGYLAMQFVL